MASNFFKIIEIKTAQFINLSETEWVINQETVVIKKPTGNRVLMWHSGGRKILSTTTGQKWSLTLKWMRFFLNGNGLPNSGSFCLGVLHMLQKDEDCPYLYMPSTTMRIFFQGRWVLGCPCTMASLSSFSRLCMSGIQRDLSVIEHVSLPTKLLS